MDADPVRVTVVVPIWDEYVRQLAGAVASIRAQTAPARVVAVDNVSAAPLPALEEVTVVRSTRRLSVGAARNLGLEHVETDYVVFLDADDLLEEGSLGFLAAELDAHPEAAVSVTSILEAETGLRHRSPRRVAVRMARFQRLFALAQSVWSLYPTQGSAMMRTAWVREAGGYGDATGGEDWVLGVSMAYRGRVRISERIGLVYHASDASLWRAHRAAADLARAAGLIRTRIRSDEAVPGWARAALPAIALLQLLAIYVVAPLYRAARAFSRRALRQASSAPGNRASIESGRHR